MTVSSISSYALTVDHLRVQSLRNPNGIDVLSPQFSWQLHSDERNVVQTAYQLMIFNDADNAHPIYRWLKSQAGFAGFDMNHELGKLMDEMLTRQDPDYAKNPDIKWNFTKFVISRDGSKVVRFESTTEPEDLADCIESML